MFTSLEESRYIIRSDVCYRYSCKDHFTCTVRFSVWLVSVWAEISSNKCKVEFLFSTVMVFRHADIVERDGLLTRVALVTSVWSV